MEDEAIIVDGDGGGGVEAAGRGEEGGVAGAIYHGPLRIFFILPVA